MEESLCISNTLQCDQDLADSLTVVAMNHCFQGRLSQGLACYDELLLVGTRARNQLHCVWAHGGRAEPLLRLGRYDEAETALRQARELLKGTISHTEEIRATGLLASCLWKSGRKDDALQIALEFATMVEKKMATVSAVEALSGAVEVILESAKEGTTDTETNHRLSRLMRYMKNHAKVFPIGAPRYWKFAGQLLALQGKLAAAKTKWQRAIACSDNVHLPSEAALVYLEEARWQTGTARIAAAAKAAAILEGTEFQPQLELAHGML